MSDTSLMHKLEASIDAVATKEGVVLRSAGALC
jgi:hypothetical protein